MEQLVDVQVSGLVVALDRQERGRGTSAIQELRAQGLDVRTIVTLDDVLEFAELPNRPIKFEQLKRIAPSTASSFDYTASYALVVMFITPFVFASEVSVPGAAFYRFSDDAGNQCWPTRSHRAVKTDTKCWIADCL